ncbi:hypothetical protein HanPSC8_Chr16g0718431 [Helianthus annuus]|nr:hypothetical protein HanPSC8_Chr16g0718431 [Helianthus annuus]
MSYLLGVLFPAAAPAFFDAAPPLAAFCGCESASEHSLALSSSSSPPSRLPLSGISPPPSLDNAALREATCSFNCLRSMSSLLDLAAPSSTVDTRSANLSVLIVSPTVSGSGLTWINISVLACPPTSWSNRVSLLFL